LPITHNFGNVDRFSKRVNDGIFNDEFITQSLLSPRVKRIWKSVNIFRNYRVVFMKHGVIMCWMGR